MLRAALPLRGISEARRQFHIYYKILNYRQNFSVKYKLYMGIVLGLVHQTIVQIKYSVLAIICLPELVKEKLDSDKNPGPPLFRVRICVFLAPPFFSISQVCKVDTGRPVSFVMSLRFWEHACGPFVFGVGGRSFHLLLQTLINFCLYLCAEIRQNLL